MANRFSALVRDSRKRVGLTQEQLASDIGVTQATIHKWENVGVRTLEPAMVRRLAGVLHLPPVAVLGALGYPVDGGAKTYGEGGDLPPLTMDDRAKVLEYANLLFQQERAEQARPPTKRRTGGGSDAA